MVNHLPVLKNHVMIIESTPSIVVEGIIAKKGKYLLLLVVVGMTAIKHYVPLSSTYQLSSDHLQTIYHHLSPFSLA